MLIELNTQISTFRGDTDPFNVVFVDDDGVTRLNVTGYTFSMSISATENPTTPAVGDFTITGTITDATNGEVEFSPLIGDVDILGDWFYDIQWTDANSKIRTISKGGIRYVQDITK